MIRFEKKLRISSGGTKASFFAKHYPVGTSILDDEGNRWEVFQDIFFNKFWHMEVED